VRRRGQNRDAVIAAADRALYAAKRAGKQCVMTADGE
jgi:GGDEF domain-containing protein